LEWRAKVELFEEIRREYEFGVGTIAGVARKVKVHRRMVREAIGSALPKPRKKTERPHSKLQAAIPFIDQILQGDRQAPRKQRHTAHRIWARLREERPDCPVAERTVREYVHDRKLALGLLAREVCVAQSYDWGVEAQVDWYEAYADLGGERTKLYVFALRSMASGAAFHCAFSNATQQAFLEAHELAFAWFGGVFHRLRFDNLSSAVKKILRGQRRQETSRFIAFRSHWRFAAEFCTPGEGHEKGGIESEAGYFRRNHWVPVPQALDLVDLNRQLAVACRQDEQRTISGRSQTVGAAQLVERPHLLPLASEGMDLALTSFPTVNGLGCAQVRTNFYSVPLAAGIEVHAKAYASRVELWHEGNCVAHHARCYGHQQQILELDHYLDVLWRKPGALAGSTALDQQRQAGLWPVSFDQIWQALMARQGKQNGTRQMVGLLKLGQQYGRDKLQESVETALEAGCSDAAAVEHLLRQDELRRNGCESVDVGALERYARPLPVMTEYDQLLTLGGAR
jgi:transposase